MFPSGLKTPYSWDLGLKRTSWPDFLEHSMTPSAFGPPMKLSAIASYSSGLVAANSTPWSEKCLSRSPCLLNPFVWANSSTDCTADDGTCGSVEGFDPGHWNHNPLPVRRAASSDTYSPPLQ